jgi:hypothetical protein
VACCSRIRAWCSNTSSNRCWALESCGDLAPSSDTPTPVALWLASTLPSALISHSCSPA